MAKLADPTKVAKALAVAAAAVVVVLLVVAVVLHSKRAAQAKVVLATAYASCLTT